MIVADVGLSMRFSFYLYTNRAIFFIKHKETDDMVNNGLNLHKLDSEERAWKSIFDAKRVILQ